MRLARFLIGLIAAVALSTQALAADRAKAMSDVHTVAVIAALGNAAKYQRVGVMVFGNEDGQIDISNWGLDDVVVSEMTAALKDHYTVKPADYDHAAFATAERGDPFSLSSKASLYDMIVQRNDRALVDAYIVVVPGGSQDIIGATNQSLDGLGLYRHPFLFATHIVADYAFFDVFVVDAYTCKTIATSQLILGQDRFDNLLPAVRRATEADFPENFADMTDAQRAGFRDRATALIKATIRPTLAHLGLQASPAAPP